jgi:hypothetical protein
LVVTTTTSKVVSFRSQCSIFHSPSFAFRRYAEPLSNHSENDRPSSKNQVPQRNLDRPTPRQQQLPQQQQQRESIRYQIIAAEACQSLARRMEQKYPHRFTFHPTKWLKFPDGTDNIEIGGFTPNNIISGEHVLFLASFHNNDVTLSQFQVMIGLLQSFIESLTVVLPFSPVGTMERIVREGQVATAATYAHSTYTNKNGY